MKEKQKERIKKVFFPFIKLLISNKVSWKLITYFIDIITWLKYEKSKLDHLKAVNKLEMYFEDKVVCSGFFKGLKYLNFNSVGSSIFPKLLGSYEMELIPIFNLFKNNNYKTIVDIGCAEGFYTVGLALQFKKAKIYAYDINEKALELCAKLAEHNQVRNRIVLNSKCEAETLNQLNLSNRNLIICDCEGYERELFKSSNSNNLKHADLIIELHPFYSVDVKQYLISLFINSHNCSIISSLDNVRKLSELQDRLSGLTKMEQHKAVEEGRPYTMDWLIAESNIYK